ncbi:flagellar protein FlaG [Lysinibacillus irui]|uniref:Flagellar protein FlaG n=1 Tax=Lysinibacillus irui TaxID=2998077 RepID=A0ABU5NG20_9BACI|nr:flagellar protein FlaG [Lysinibacillus irui]MEA0554074.1 flagellar protein FlaG [Lysinibacillus irui]MEA0974984.1 flagellar protein FlaG [Lysinibacillus irui]MEA1041138.1 flagellar protein FlaG [Lysinibacillus irui]
MRISENTRVDAKEIIQTVTKNTSTVEGVTNQGKEVALKIPISKVEQAQLFENAEETKAKVKQAVNTMNHMLEISNSATKFVYHEGLERYYVTVVDQGTDEVVKEIPPKKLLDAFYEMQKMLGMIVDEKI